MQYKYQIIEHITDYNRENYYTIKLILYILGIKATYLLLVAASTMFVILYTLMIIPTIDKTIQIYMKVALFFVIFAFSFILSFRTYAYFEHNELNQIYHNKKDAENAIVQILYRNAINKTDPPEE